LNEIAGMPGLSLDEGKKLRAGPHISITLPALKAGI